MGYFLYNLLLIPAFPFILLVLALRNIKRINKGFLKSVPERFGAVNFSFGKKVVWIHCSSLGESRLGVRITEELRKVFPENIFVFSVMTQTAYEWADKQKKTDMLFYLPFDLNFVMRRFVKKLNPAALIILETELWPNLIRTAHETGAKILLANARISDKNYGILRKMRFFTKNVFSYFDSVLARTRKDSERFKSLGAAAEKVILTGNMKYDMTDLGGIDSGADDMVITAGSVRKGEEEIILSAFREVKNEFPKLKMIMAPRHLERVEFIRGLIDKYSLAGDVAVLDRYGELINAYAKSRICVIGGSLVDYGGQNLIEPALLGKAIVCGPFMSNFEDTFEMLKSEGALAEVKDGASLASELKKLLNDLPKADELGRKAKEAVSSQMGALSKNVEAIKKVLSQ